MRQDEYLVEAPSLIAMMQSSPNLWWLSTLLELSISTSRFWKQMTWEQHTPINSPRESIVKSLGGNARKPHILEEEGGEELLNLFGKEQESVLFIMFYEGAGLCSNSFSFIICRLMIGFPKGIPWNNCSVRKLSCINFVVISSSQFTVDLSTFLPVGSETGWISCGGTQS